MAGKHRVKDRHITMAASGLGKPERLWTMAAGAR
jgi:hypothetical protein